MDQAEQALRRLDPLRPCALRRITHQRSPPGGRPLHVIEDTRMDDLDEPARVDVEQEHRALALSMHTHLLAATVWRWRPGQPVEPLLRHVAEEQIVLVSTGASDWLDSSGTADRVEGGYRVTGRKIFGSGSPAGTLLVTSAVYDDPADGPIVLHFPVPLAAEGVTVLDNWRTLGMCVTGSNDVLLENVFVPEGAVSLRRPKGQWHTFFNVVVTIALPLVMSVYAGVAEAASRW